MSWRPQSTKDVGLREPHKVLLYGHHGWGKTWQMRNFANRYGKGLILSGEAGLRSLSDVDIAKVDFSSFDGPHDPDNGVFSFRGLAKWISSSDFKDEEYKWIGLDSLTELSAMTYDWAEKETDKLATKSGKANGFALWEMYGNKMLGTLKWFRDLDMHVFVTALAAESTDDNANPDFWPMVKGSKVAKNIPGIFDHVMCGVRKDKTVGDEVQTTRLVVTEQISGWHGKVRDPYRRVKAVEEVSDITEILERMSRTEAEHKKHMEEIAAVTKAAAELEAMKGKAS